MTDVFRELIRRYFACPFFGAILFACSPEPTPLVTWSGEFLEFKHSSSLEICQGTHTYIDGYVPFVAAELGLDAPTGLSYSWLDSEAFSKSPCRPFDLGCTPGNTALARSPFLLHEVVHAVAYESELSYQPFFGEGMAVALDPWQGSNMGPRYVTTIDPGPLPDPRDWMPLDVEDLHYYTAGSFVMFLLARHGPGPFVEMTRKLAGSRDMAVIRGVFGAAYGIALDDEAELFMTGAPCTDESFNLGLYDCTMPEVPWGATDWEFSGVMDCDSEDVAGGIGPDKAWRSIRSVTVEIAAPGLYQIVAQSDGDVLVQMGRCFGCPWQDRDVGVPMGEVTRVELEAGTHYVRMRASSDESPSITVFMLPVPESSDSI